METFPAGGTDEEEEVCEGCGTELEDDGSCYECDYCHDCGQYQEDCECDDDEEDDDEVSA